MSPLTGAVSAQRSSLEIPLDSAHIFTARLFAGGVARSLELGDESADALRLVLTEVCSEAIERWSDGRIAIEIVADADRVRAAIVATGSPVGDAHGGGVDATYRRTLIEALAPDATFVEEPRSSIVTFTLPAV
jgi:anti-sigma regulatory factor (Ser/Thr protein kinase)